MSLGLYGDFIRAPRYFISMKHIHFDRIGGFFYIVVFKILAFLPRNKIITTEISRIWRV